MVYIPQMRESISGWVGDGRLVYSTGKKPNTPLADNSALQELQAPYKKAQAQRRADQAAQKAARQAGKNGQVTVYDASKRAYVSATPQQAKEIREANREIQAQRRAAQTRKSPKTGNVTVFDASQRAYVSATPQQAKEIREANKSVKSARESMGVFIKHDIEQALSKKNPLNPGILDHNLGFDKAPKSAQESASAFIEHGLTDTEKALGETTTKSSGFIGSVKNMFNKAKNALSSGFSKAKSFFKSPKGKYTLIAAAVIAAGAALWGYVSDRFSDKNKPEPSDAKYKPYMPKLEEEVEKTEEVSEPEKNEEENENAENDSANVVPVPVPVDEKNDETEKTDEKDKTNETDKTDDLKNDTNKDVVPSNVHKVVKGDNLWNIAKQHLKEIHKDDPNYEPSNKEILEKTEELMKLNNKEYEQPLPEDSRKRKVLIVPDEEIKLK